MNILNAAKINKERKKTLHRVKHSGLTGPNSPTETANIQIMMDERVNEE